MKKFALLTILIFIFSLMLSACQKDSGESLAFIEETESGAAGEKETVPVQVIEKPVSFSKDWDQDSRYSFFMDAGRYYFIAGDTKNRFLYAADPVSLTYRPLCRKEGCTHSDSSCYGALVSDEDGVRTGGSAPQLYDDGIYQPAVRETDGGNAVLEYYRIDPNGRKPKQVSWEIPLDGLMFVTENYQVYPSAYLHRGTCIIESSKHEEAEKVDLEEELSGETDERRVYNPGNPFNGIASMRYNDTVYVSAYDLESKTMRPVFEKTYEGFSYVGAFTIAAEDELYIIVRPNIDRPVTIIYEDGRKDFDIKSEELFCEIYRWHFGSEDAAELVYKGALFEEFGGMRIQNSQMLFFDLRGKTSENGSRGATVLCSLDFDNGKVTDIGTIYSEEETRDGLSGAYFLDGMIFGRKFTADPLADGVFKNVPEIFSIYELNGEKETDISFSEDLPPVSESYSVGANVCGTDGQALYCNNSTKDRQVFYIIPLNGDPVQFFRPADDTDAGMVFPEDLPPETEQETASAVYDDEEFPEMDPTSSGFDVAFAQDDEHIYFPYAFGAYGQEYVMCAAEKKTGKRTVLCDMPDCPHNSESCEAYAGSGFYPFAITVTNRRLYTATETVGMENSILIRAYDLDTKDWSEITSVGLKTSGIQKNNYSMQNWQAFFHRDCFYYYVVRSKQSGSFPAYTATELTAIIYEVPLSNPSAARFILNEDYPAEEFNNIYLKASGSGNRILYTVYASRFRYEKDDAESGEGNYLTYLENPMLQIGAVDLSSGSREILYETQEPLSADSLYPDGDVLYYTAWLPRNSLNEPLVGNDLNLYRFDTKTGENVCVAKDVAAFSAAVYVEPPENDASGTDDDMLPDYYSMFFCRDGYVVLKPPSSYDESKTAGMYCAFYNLKGEKIREFNYQIPDILKADREKYDNYPVWKYFGADPWNLYFSDVYSNAKESLCLVYAIPTAGDNPVVFGE